MSFTLQFRAVSAFRRVAVVVSAGLLLPSCSLDDEIVGRLDSQDVIHIEGYIDGQLGIEVFVSRPVSVGREFSLPEDGWVTDATISVHISESGESAVLQNDTLGIYSLADWRGASGESVVLSVEWEGQTATVEGRLPAPPRVRVGEPVRLNPIDSDEDTRDESVEVGLVIETEEESAILVGSDFWGATQLRLPQEYGIASSSAGAGPGCRQYPTPRILSSACGKSGAPISAGVYWLASSITGNRVLGKVAAVEDGLMSYIDVHYWNSIDWDVTGELVYSNQSANVSNVKGGIGYVSVQTSLLFEVDVP